MKTSLAAMVGVTDAGIVASHVSVSLGSQLPNGDSNVPVATRPFAS